MYVGFVVGIDRASRLTSENTVVVAGKACIARARVYGCARTICY